MRSHLAAMARELGRLANSARVSAPPEDVAEKVGILSRQACELLDAHAWSGPYAVEQLAPPANRLLVWEPADLRRTIPYSPVLGDLNPMSGEARVWADGDAIRGTLRADPIHAGPLGAVHGGVVASVLDELTSLAVLATGHVGYTKSLTIDYRRPTPLGPALELWAQTAGIAGGVLLTSAEIRHDGRVTVSAVSVHKAAGRRDDPIYPADDRDRRSPQRGGT
ncbi:PaaI family thioesterase [Nocardia aobensis]|uniref:PaaI family thioesterase n=1 Tax=Nocardia aobensis TaxID=257277 RepID=A0ABW6P9M1_9NOCA